MTNSASDPKSLAPSAKQCPQLPALLSEHLPWGSRGLSPWCAGLCLAQGPAPHLPMSRAELPCHLPYVFWGVNSVSF